MADQDPQQPVVAHEESTGALESLGEFIIEHFPAPAEYNDVFDYVEHTLSAFAPSPLPILLGPVGGVVQGFLHGGEQVAGLAKYFYEQYGGADPKVDIAKLLDVNNLVPESDVSTPGSDELNRVVSEIDGFLVPEAEETPVDFLPEITPEDIIRTAEESGVTPPGQSGSDDTDLNAVSPFDPTGAARRGRDGFVPREGSSGSDANTDDTPDTSNDPGGSGTDDTPSDPFPGGSQDEDDERDDRGEGDRDTAGHSPVDERSGSAGEGEPEEDDGAGGGGSGGGAEVDSEGPTVDNPHAYRDEDGNWYDENGNPLPPEEAAKWEEAYQEDQKNQQDQEGEGDGSGGETPGVSTTPIDEAPPLDPFVQQLLNAELRRLRSMEGAGGGGNGATDPPEDAGFDVPVDVSVSDLPDKVDWIGNTSHVDVRFGVGVGDGPPESFTRSNGDGVIYREFDPQTSGAEERAQDTLPPGAFGSGAGGGDEAEDVAPASGGLKITRLRPELRGVQANDGSDALQEAVSRRSGPEGLHGGRYQAAPAETNFPAAEATEGDTDDTGVSPLSPAVVVDSPYDDVAEELKDAIAG